MHRLKHKRPKIGVIVGWQAYTGTLDSFLDHVFRGIQANAQEHDCNLFLACGMGPSRAISFGRPAWPILVPEADFLPVGPWNTDGLIVMPPLAVPAGKFYFDGLVSGGFPLVYAGDMEHGPAVIVDNQGGIFPAFDHLVEHGHR